MACLASAAAGEEKESNARASEQGKRDRASHLRVRTSAAQMELLQSNHQGHVRRPACCQWNHGTSAKVARGGTGERFLGQGDL